jgi:pyruvate,orthophosphate dikinase
MSGSTPRPGFTLRFDQADPGDAGRLGGKGAGLARMTRHGLRVPPGFIVGTDACREYLRSDSMPAGLLDEVHARLAELEALAGKSFGRGPVPLLLSVRSGAPVSMPGMMDTILNLGISRDAAVALATATGDTRFMADVVARFHAMYGEIVLGAFGDEEPAEELAGIGPSDDPGAAFDHVWAGCARRLEEETGQAVPADPREQLAGAIGAVFGSWNNSRARTYRDYHRIPHDVGTAVVVQSMVFGNLGADSGSGVVFTRDPATGEPGLFGEYLARSQGEDVVAGIRTPDPVREALPPRLLAELERTGAALERQIGDVADIEFTVERSTLYLLQVRAAKRTPQAAVRIAADFAAEGTVPLGAALRQVSAEQVRQLQHPGFDEAELALARGNGRLLTAGIGACPGQVSGELVLDPDRARDLAAAGRRVVLARSVTSPADLHGMIAAAGIVTATGGSTSHAAVVARALGRACVVGAAALSIDAGARAAIIGERVIREGEPVSLDGASGEVFAGAITTGTPAEAGGALGALMDVTALAAADCAVFGKVTLPGDVCPALSAGARGLVTALDDVLAATGQLDALLRVIADQGDAQSPDFGPVAGIVAAGLTPLLRAIDDHSAVGLDHRVAGAGHGTAGLEVGVRAIDLVADESLELMQQSALTGRYPLLGVPLGIPGLVKAQILGLRQAIADSGTTAAVHLALRHVSDPAEARALRALSPGSESGPPAVSGPTAESGPPAESGPTVGAYLTSPRALANFDGIAAGSDRVWLELRVLQAAMFGIPARLLLTAEPLDSYVQRGLLATDPRRAVDPSLNAALASVASGDSADSVGIRLSGAVSEEMVATLHAMGFRRFAVDPPEIRPARLALAKAALSK